MLNVKSWIPSICHYTPIEDTLAGLKDCWALWKLIGKALKKIYLKRGGLEAIVCSMLLSFEYEDNE